jgi:hypothetical protein
MAQQHGDLINRNSCQEHFDRECIPQHVGEAAFGGTVRVLQRCELEEPTEAPLPVGYRTLWQTISAPKEISWIGLHPLGYRAQRIGYLRREGNIHRRSRLRLIEQQIVVDEPGTFECDCIPNAQAAPPHQHEQGTEARAIGAANRLAAILAIQIRGVDELVILLRVK